MSINENDKEFKETEENDNTLKLFIDSNEEEKYLLKIFSSKENESLIFKLEKEKIKTYYYYARLYFRDFKVINKIFVSDNNINNVFIRLKEIIQNYSCSIKKEQMKIIISFSKSNNKYNANFILRKKNVPQNRLNYQLLQQIQENKAKIKNLKKQIAKLDKVIENKNNIIDNIKTDISQIVNSVNDINIKEKNIEGNDLDNSKINNNKNISLKGEDFMEKNIINNNNNREKIIEQNISSLKEEKDKKSYISNNKKRKDKNNNKNKSQKGEKIDPKSIKEFSFLCFTNINIYNYRKIYEILIIFNVVSIFIIMYLICYLYVLKSNLTIEKIKDFDLMKQIKTVNYNMGNFDTNNDIRGLRENIVDFQLRNNNEENNENPPKKKQLIIIRKKNPGQRKKISLLTQEKEIFYYKKHIGRRIHHRVRDVNLELKYNSNEHDNYKDYTNDFDNDYKVLILMISQEGHKYGVFLNHSILYNQGLGNDDADYSGYIYNNNRIDEITLKEFYNKHGTFLKNIIDFIMDNKINDTNPNKNNETITQSLGDIIIFEIYQVNVMKKHNQMI